jgi:dihydroceramidase
MARYYWEPHTSSIDFCEANYLHHDNVVELHNTWSSLAGIVSFGVIGAIWNNPTREIRTALAYFILILIGVGSTGLHLSLHWIFQASDELPMLYLNNCINFMCLEHNAPKGKPNYPSLPTLFGLMTIMQTIIYYRFQDNYIIFFFSYASGVFLLLIMGYRIVYLGRDRRGPITRQLFALSVIAFFLVGLPVWILDALCCESILGLVETGLLLLSSSSSSSSSLSLWRGITPHVVWHFASAFGTYCAISCAVACRMEELMIPFRLRYLLGVVPVFVRTDEEMLKQE